MDFLFSRVSTPIGRLAILTKGNMVVRIDLAGSEADDVREWLGRHGERDFVQLDDDPPESVASQLQGFLAGRLRHFDVPTHLLGTDFQVSVWRALERIPFGDVRSYGDIAREIGSPAAFRAVGLACGKNPIPLIVPCHRVVASGGRLGGFGGGIELKLRLLELEGRDVATYRRQQRSSLNG